MNEDVDVGGRVQWHPMDIKGQQKDKTTTTKDSICIQNAWNTDMCMCVFGTFLPRIKLTRKVKRELNVQTETSIKDQKEAEYFSPFPPPLSLSLPQSTP